MKIVPLVGSWHMRRQCKECGKTYPMYEKNHRVCEECGTHPMFRVVARRTSYFFQEEGFLEHIAAFFGVLKYPKRPKSTWEFRPLNNYWKEP